MSQRKMTCPAARASVALLLMSLSLSACQSGGTEDSRDTTAAEKQAPVEDEPAASPRDIEVEQSFLTYMYDSTGGNFHNAIVLLRNNSDQVAIDVSGQISILENGELVQSVTPIPVNILPGDEGLFQELLDLPYPVEHGQIEVQISVDRFQEWDGEAPVSFSNLWYGLDEIAGCTITGTVHNTFTEQKDDLQLRVAGFVGDDLATGDFTYVDTVFPETDATFEVFMPSAAQCPRKLDEIGVYPNLGEDKIFNP